MIPINSFLNRRSGFNEVIVSTFVSITKAGTKELIYQQVICLYFFTDILITDCDIISPSLLRTLSFTAAVLQFYCQINITFFPICVFIIVNTISLDICWELLAILWLNIYLSWLHSPTHLGFFLCFYFCVREFTTPNVWLCFLDVVDIKSKRSRKETSSFLRDGSFTKISKWCYCPQQ